jgi:hypothetical protein
MTRKSTKRRAVALLRSTVVDPLALLRAARANGAVTEEQYRMALRQMLARAGLLLGVVQK